MEKGDKIIFTASTFFNSYKFNQTHKNVKIDLIAHNKFGSPQSGLLGADMLVEEATTSNIHPSYAQNYDGSFWAVNYGDRLDWSWKNQSFNPWSIKIWQCADASCSHETLLKNNRQNDYLANTDYILTDGTKSNLYFRAVGYSKGKILKNFGIIRVPSYK